MITLYIPFAMISNGGFFFQLESLQNRCHLNAELERLSLTERLIAGPTTVMSAIEEKLRHFEEDLQIAKSEALRNQQAVICFRNFSILASTVEHLMHSSKSHSTDVAAILYSTTKIAEIRCIN